jgi:hypothetical protein
VNGNATLTGNGGGLLLVTGTLILKGNFNFNGLILVLGQGRVERDGGGNGTIQGNVIIGKYDPTNLGAGFGAAYYDMDGGGNSTVVFNSNSNANTQNAFTGFIVGVAEK